MSDFKVYQDYCLDATLVSNAFIDCYMKDANDAQLKIYLYLLRVLCAHKSCSISDLADKFNYTEKDVTRALKYWEKNGLLSLEYDGSKNLKGVRLLDISADPDDLGSSYRNDTITLAPIVQIPLRTEPKEVPAAPAPRTPSAVKKDYSADDVSAFRNSDSFSELIFVVEQYLGRTLTPTDIKTMLYIKDELGFSSELIDYLFEYCVGKGKKDIRYIEKVALIWHEQDIHTPKEAAKNAYKYDKEVYDIMKMLGRNSSPTRSEAGYIKRWTDEYGFDTSVIAEACNRTVLATDSHRFEYADKILKSWNSEGIHTLSQIGLSDEKFAEKKISPSGNSKAQYRQFTHRSSSPYSDLEKELLSN